MQQKGCHIDPDEAVVEISNWNLVCFFQSYLRVICPFHSLSQVAGAVKALWNEPRLLLMGDFNAGCNYVSSSDWSSISLRQHSNYTWLISDSTDTTTVRELFVVFPLIVLKGTTSCPYDRFVVTTEMLPAYVDGSAVPFDFAAAYGLSSALTLDVSDHLPIELTLSNSATTSSPPTSSSSSSSSTSGKSNKAGLIAGVVIGVLVCCRSLRSIHWS